MTTYGNHPLPAGRAVIRTIPQKDPIVIPPRRLITARPTTCCTPGRLIFHQPGKFTSMCPVGAGAEFGATGPRVTRGLLLCWSRTPCFFGGRVQRSLFPASAFLCHDNATHYPGQRLRRRIQPVPRPAEVPGWVQVARSGGFGVAVDVLNPTSRTSEIVRRVASSYKAVNPADCRACSCPQR